MSVIAVVGNHQVIYCTESELAWTLEDMGHTVIRFQENGTTTEAMLTHSKHHGVQLFLYIHTHGWSTPGRLSFDDLLTALKAEGIKTASFHLDRYWGIPAREAQLCQHPFWHTDKVFTADGGHDGDFLRKGIPHQWLPPAVAKRHCYRGTSKLSFVYDVVFVGAKCYHVEYPFREQLITWLEHTYGYRFRRFAGDAVGGVIRENDLNDLYASAKVIVGDSCFAGAPYYWSDRIPETLGRGGFLIHPRTEGLAINGLATFTPGDLNQLHEKIEYYLTHPEERTWCASQAMADVQLNHTYHQRMHALLESMIV